MKQEIIEGNKLIADFMDLEPMKWVSEMSGDAMKIWVDKKKKMTVYDEPELYYHTSWDWLMPVVEKIEGLKFSVQIIRKGCYISDWGIPDFSEIVVDDDSKIQSTWQAVIQFIQWYNQNPK